MKRSLVLMIGLAVLALAVAGRADGQECQPCGLAAGPSWVFRPSTYSHNPMTGERVNQFQPEKPAYARFDPTYLESGYRQYHAALRSADGGYDHTHVVQTWGQGEFIRPYGEWEYPFRAGATPYGPWGNPQGPWTMPFDSWANPYGLGQLPNPPWPGGYGPYGSPYQAPMGAPPYGSGGGPYRAPAGTPPQLPYGPPHQQPGGSPPYGPYSGAHQPSWGGQAPSPYGDAPAPLPPP